MKLVLTLQTPMIIKGSPSFLGFHGPHFKSHCFKDIKGHLIQPGRMPGGFVKRVKPELRFNGHKCKKGLTVQTQGIPQAKAPSVKSRSLFLSVSRAKGAARTGPRAEIARDTDGLGCMKGAETSFFRWQELWKVLQSRGAMRLELSQLQHSGDNMVNGFGRFTLERGSSIKNQCLVKVRDD